MAGTGFAQISEFSLILVFLGQSVGHLSETVTATITMVAVITIGISTYLILYNNRIYEAMFNRIPFLKKLGFIEEALSRVEEKNYPLVLLGFGETGKKIFSSIKMPPEDILVIDYDPRIVKRCIGKKLHCLYGDASDIEMVKFIKRKKPKIVVSTVMDIEINSRLAEQFKKKKKGQTLIILAASLKDAKYLYDKKADFVLVPTQIAAERIGIIIKDLQKGKHFELEWLSRIHENVLDDKHPLL
jgi:hypothetical protein